MVNQASARLRPVEDIADDVRAAASDAVLVHVRYHPNGEVLSIGEKPERLSESQWLKHLLDTASPHYQAFAGGRGFFRIPRGDFESLIRRLPD